MKQIKRPLVTSFLVALSITLALGWLLLPAALQSADIPSSAKAIKLVSENHEYTVTITPQKAKDGYASATLKKKSDPNAEVTFKLVNRFGPLEAILFNDGSLMTFDDWPHIGIGQVIVCYHASGKMLWSHTLSDLFSEEKLGFISKEQPSRWWRKMPLEWRYEFRNTPGESIIITLQSEDRLRIKLLDGATEYLAMLDLGQEAKRWTSRAQTLLKNPIPQDKNYSEAKVAFRKAINSDPHSLEAYQGLAELYFEDRDYAHAIQVLIEAIKENPISDRSNLIAKSSTDIPLPIKIRFTLAKVYQEDRQEREALNILEEIDALSLSSWSIQKQLAEIFFEFEYPQKADRVLEKAFNQKINVNSEWNTSSTFARACVEVGSVYEDRQNYNKAVEYFLKGTNQATMHEPLYEHLANAYQKLGQKTQAIDILDKLIERAKKNLSSPYQYERLDKLTRQKKELES